MDEYNLGTGDRNDISRWFTAKRAAGIVPQPWELEKMLEAKYGALYNQRAQMRGLGNQEKMLGIQDKMVGLNTDRLAETRRMNDVRVQQGELDRGAAKEAGMWGLGTNLATLAAMYPYLKRG
jgi:hypothetical protein